MRHEKQAIADLQALLRNVIPLRNVCVNSDITPCSAVWATFSFFRKVEMLTFSKIKNKNVPATATK